MKILIGLLVLMLVGCGGRAARTQAQDPGVPAESGEASAPADEKSQVIKQAGRYGVKTRVVFKTKDRRALKPHDALVCMLAGPLPDEITYIEIGQIVATKGTYGGIDEVLHAMAEEGRRIGVDAIVELQSRHRGSPVVWRMSTPTGKGRLVKLRADSPPLDCEKIGGKPT